MMILCLLKRYFFNFYQWNYSFIISFFVSVPFWVVFCDKNGSLCLVFVLIFSGIILHTSSRVFSELWSCSLGFKVYQSINLFVLKNILTCLFIPVEHFVWDNLFLILFKSKFRFLSWVGILNHHLITIFFHCIFKLHCSFIFHGSKLISTILMFPMKKTISKLRILFVTY